VDTGSFKTVATFSQIAAAVSAHNMPYKKMSGWDLKEAVLAIPPAMVLVTAAPSPIAPENSNTAAITVACRKVRAPDPTEVPKALATSLAPVVQHANFNRLRCDGAECATCGTSIVVDMVWARLRHPR
jgi:hypothetical protein